MTTERPDRDPAQPTSEQQIRSDVADDDAIGGDRLIPPSVSPGRRTPTFSAESVPPALLSAHTTTVWAQLVVTAGSVRFHDEEPPWETTATPYRPVVIVPHRLHHVAPAPDAEFHVQFFEPVPDGSVGTDERASGRSAS